MAIGQILGIATGLIPSLFKGISGIKQLNQANNMNPVDPGFTMNQGILDNSRILQERASNYQIPGYNQAVNNINMASGQAFSRGVQGATSGGDVLDLASKLAYGQSQQLNNLALQNAQGVENAQLQSLNANALAGQQYQDKNAYDRDIYQQQLRERAALRQAGNENLYGALDSAATIGTRLLSPRDMSSSGQQLTPQQLQAQQAYYKLLNNQ